MRLLPLSFGPTMPVRPLLNSKVTSLCLNILLIYKDLRAIELLHDYVAYVGVNGLRQRSVDVEAVEIGCVSLHLETFFSDALAHDGQAVDIDREGFAVFQQNPKVHPLGVLRDRVEGDGGVVGPVWILGVGV